ncbi:hypothetical protein CYMTET_51327, partial [Cymbomonas tetramitiformis]
MKKRRRGGKKRPPPWKKTVYAEGQRDPMQAVVNSISKQRLNEDVGKVLDVKRLHAKKLSTLLQKLSRTPHCLRLLDWARDEGFKINTFHYNIVISAVGRSGTDWKTAMRLYREMQTFEVKPDRYTYNALITCCQRAGRWQLSKQAFEEMKLFNVTPDVVTYNALITSYGKAKRGNLALKAY